MERTPQKGGLLKRAPENRSRPGSGRLNHLKNEFCGPTLELDEEILPCEAPVAALLQKSTPPNTPEGMLPGEFDPNGLNQTYRDHALNMELPRFAAVNVRKTAHTIQIEKSTLQKSKSTSLSSSWNDLDGKYTPRCQFLPSHTGLQKLRESEAIRKTILASFCLPAFLVAASQISPLLSQYHIWTSRLTLPNWLGAGMPALAAGTLAAALVLLILWPILKNLGKRTLQEKVSFQLPGFVPDKIRTQIKNLAPHYDDLYLVCDAENAWETHGTEYLSEQKKKELDPLLIGEKKGKFFLLGWFDLSEKERKLARA